MNRKPVLHCADDSEIELPCKWVICSRCEGHGTDRGASVESDGGGITADEMAELGDDFREDYLAGVYDKPCAHCDGKGKVMTADRSKMTRAMWAKWCAQCADDRDFRRIERMERLMGA